MPPTGIGGGGGAFGETMPPTGRGGGSGTAPFRPGLTGELEPEPARHETCVRFINVSIRPKPVCTTVARFAQHRGYALPTWTVAATKHKTMAARRDHNGYRKQHMQRA